MYKAAEYKIAREVVKYKAARPYFGDLTGKSLSIAKHTMEEMEYGNSYRLVVGDIDGDVICNALWQQMSYNPLRFGKYSPFTYNGNNNIYRFATDSMPAQWIQDSDARRVMLNLQGKLRYYLSMCAGPNRQWNDKFPAQDGEIILIDRHGNPVRALTAIQDCVRRIIAPQNGSDFRSAARFRDSITDQVQIIHPELFRGNTR